MKKNTIPLTLSLILLLWSFVYFVPPAEAQTKIPSPSVRVSPTLVPDKLPTTGIHITLSPVFLNITTNPGLPVTTDFKVTNNNNQREYFKLSLIKFKVDNTGANVVPMDITNDDEFAKWISFPEDSFSLEPNETKTLKFTISPPQNAALGYYYGIQVGRLQERKAGERQTVVTGSAVLPVLLEVRSPNAKKELTIIDFSTSHFVYEYLPVDFKTDVKNVGNVHVIPFGDIFITDANGKQVASVPANEMRSNVLPEARRELISNWNDGFPTRQPKKKPDGSYVTDKDGKVEYETKWDFSKIANFRIGKYTANVVMAYNDGKRDVPLQAAVSFWVLPWKIILALLVLVLFVLLGIKSMISSIFKRK
jgi:hypothetical protein